MKGKFSLNRLLHNKKLMIFFSVVAAIAVWASIHAVSSEAESVITTTVPLSLEGTYAGNNNMRIFSGANPKVKVKVKGSLFDVTNLKEDDIEVNGDYDVIKGVGNWNIKLSASRKGSGKDFSVVSVTPSTAEVFCDYYDEVSVKVEADISGVDVDKSTGYLLGSPFTQPNTIKIGGPKSIVRKITTIKAKVDQPRTISDVTDFSASLIALDDAGDTVNTELCTYIGLTNKENKVSVKVPVQVKRTINFTYDLNPTTFKNRKNFVTVSPASIEVVGTPEQVDTFAGDISKLGTFDFNHISLNDKQKTINLNIPQGINVLDGTSKVIVSFNMDGFTSKTLSMTLSSQNTQVVNKPADRAWAMTPQNINVILVGNKASINKIKAASLSAVIDMAGDNNTGVREYRAMIQMPDYDDVWVYYGPNEPSGYTAYLTIS